LALPRKSGKNGEFRDNLEGYLILPRFISPEFSMHLRHAAAIAVSCVMFFSNDANARGLLDEVRFGVFDHDSGIIGSHKEDGVDYALEVLTGPLIKTRLLGAPRLVLGGAINSAGQTDQAYLGIDGQWTLARALFSRRDAIYFEATIGGGWNDGKIDVIGTPLEADWKSHGSHFLIRSGASLGYRFGTRWAMAFAFNHISNSGLAHKNEGMNDIGLLLGFKI
jgi:hypothetical protein